MPLKVSRAVVDSKLRSVVFSALKIDQIPAFHKINDRQFGCIVEDANGVRRYVRVGAIVAEVREDCTADELMASEIATYEAAQAKKAEQRIARAEKAKKDKAKREAEKDKEGD